MQSRQFLTSQLIFNRNWPQFQKTFPQMQNCPLPHSPPFQANVSDSALEMETTFATDRDKSPNFCQHYYSICVCLLFQTVLSPCVAYGNKIPKHITDKPRLTVHCSQMTNKTVSQYTLYIQSQSKQMIYSNSIYQMKHSMQTTTSVDLQNRRIWWEAHVTSMVEYIQASRSLRVKDEEKANQKTQEWIAGY